jgi:peptidoglycan/LPS O-acetylase OafA/YrhL
MLIGHKFALPLALIDIARLTGRSMGDKVSSRNTALDGLRGYAALGVALGHSVLAITGLALWSTSLRDFPSMSGAEIFYRLLSLVAPSDAAVMLFFVLSGHVLWQSFARKNLGAPAVPDYLVSRIFRLFPLIVVTSVLIGLLKHAGFAAILRTAILWNVTLNGVLWSLQVEVIGSVVIVLVWLLARQSGARLLAALAVSLLILPLVRGTPLVFMPAFLLGALIGVVPDWLWRSRLLFAAGLALLIGTNIVIGHGGATRLPEMTGATLVVGCMGALPIRALRTRLSRFLGEISYPFYLVHPIGMIFGFHAVAGLAGAPVLVRIAIFAVVSIGIAIPLAWLLHIAVETPAMRRGRHLRIAGVAV